VGHPWQHALSSAKKFGGRPEDYLHLHDWFDGSIEVVSTHKMIAVLEG